MKDSLIIYRDNKFYFIKGIEEPELCESFYLAGCSKTTYAKCSCLVVNKKWNQRLLTEGVEVHALDYVEVNTYFFLQHRDNVETEGIYIYTSTFGIEFEIVDGKARLK